MQDVIFLVLSTLPRMQHVIFLVGSPWDAKTWLGEKALFPVTLERLEGLVLAVFYLFGVVSGVWEPLGKVGEVLGVVLEVLGVVLEL